MYGGPLVRIRIIPMGDQDPYHRHRDAHIWWLDTVSVEKNAPRYCNNNTFSITPEEP